jgi:hypothetical protein
MRNLKALGLALFAVFALSAMAASTASAQTNGTLTSESSPVWIHGEDEPNIPIPLTAFGGVTPCLPKAYTGGKVDGTTAGGHHEGLSSGTSKFTLLPEDSLCIIGAWRITISLNGCDYVFHIAGTQKPDVYDTVTDLSCPEGKEATIGIYFTHEGFTSNPERPDCEYRIPPHVGLVGATLSDEGNGHLTLGGTIGNMDMTRTEGFCGSHAVFPSSTAWHISMTLQGRDAATNGDVALLSLSHE